MVAIAKSESTQRMIMADLFSTADEIRDLNPGRFTCYYCGEELHPIRGHFVKKTDGVLELNFYRNTHFKHLHEKGCYGDRGQSLEHMLSLKHLHDNLTKASFEHFNGAVIPSYEPLLKSIEATRRPDIGLVYKGAVIGSCEAQLSQVSDRSIIERSNDQLSLGLAGSWWVLDNLRGSIQSRSLLGTYGSSYEIIIDRSRSETILVNHPTMGPDYPVPVENPVVLGVTKWSGDAVHQKEVITDVSEDYYPHFIDSMLSRDRSFNCHDRFVPLEPIQKKVLNHKDTKRKLVSFNDAAKDVDRIKGLEVRTKNGTLLGVVESTEGSVAIVRTPDQLLPVEMVYLYIDKNILDACLKKKADDFDAQAIASRQAEQIRDIRKELIANSIKPASDYTKKLDSLIGEWAFWKNAPYWWGDKPAEIISIIDGMVQFAYLKDLISLDDITIVN